MMVRVLIYGYSRSVASSRRIERATYEDVAFRLPEIERQQRMGKGIAFRGDAAFAKPALYEVLEERDVKYAIRIPANDILQRDTEELKSDLAADDFCLEEFIATEAAFLAILMLFNLLGEIQRTTAMPGYRQPATLRLQVFLCGATLGRAHNELEQIKSPHVSPNLFMKHSVAASALLRKPTTSK